MAKSDGPVNPLGDHEGRPTTEVAVTLPKVAGGLVEAFKLQPVKHRQGDRVYIIFEGEVGDASYVRIKEKGIDTGNNRRVEKIEVSLGAFVDEAVARPLIDAEAEKLRRLRIEQAGQFDLEGDPLEGLNLDEVDEDDGGGGGRPEPEWDDEEETG